MEDAARILRGDKLPYDAILYLVGILHSALTEARRLYLEEVVLADYLDYIQTHHDDKTRNRFGTGFGDLTGLRTFAKFDSAVCNYVNDDDHKDGECFYHDEDFVLLFTGGDRE